ncbi:Gas2-Like Protein 2 [Manis pentadactyla]|nr:Gas2-Like Protein 2 [Manis pentadactyla]
MDLGNAMLAGNTQAPAQAFCFLFPRIGGAHRFLLFNNGNIVSNFLIVKMILTYMKTETTQKTVSCSARDFQQTYNVLGHRNKYDTIDYKISHELDMF